MKDRFHLGEIAAADLEQADTVGAAVGIAALAAGFQGWALVKTNTVERVMFIVAGFALVYPTTTADVIGFGLVVTAIVLQVLRRKVVPA